jgi:hypothetical protein
MNDSLPPPGMGRLTFDAEGQEGGRYHSRHLHIPSQSSGLTLGRGYDMKNRSRSEVRDDLVAAGVAPEKAALLSQAAGRSGAQAEEFVAENDLEDFEISWDQQRRLFEIEYERQTADARRLATKADVCRAYGDTDWDALDPVIREVLVDLRFRGDYTPSTRRFLQQHVARNDRAAFVAEMCDPARWPDVPGDRFRRRRDFCMGA